MQVRRGMHWNTRFETVMCGWRAGVPFQYLPETHDLSRRWLCACMATLSCCLLFISVATAAPGDALFTDDFESGLSQWNIATSGGDVSVGNETASAGSSMRIRWDTASANSISINAAVPAAELTLWIRRGSNSFSDRPDNGEDLILEYRTNTNTWSVLETIPGQGQPGQVFDRAFPLPTDALHANLSIRFRLLNGSGEDDDYYHIDNVAVTEAAATVVSGGNLGLGTCENFEDGLAGWSVSSSGGGAGVSAATAASGTNSLYTRWGSVTVTSNAVDMENALNASLSVWIRRGSNSFSDRPDNGEDLVVEYFTIGSTWLVLETFPGQGQPGQVFDRTFPLPADALHPDFQIRIRQTGGSGTDQDYWHTDDVCLTGSKPLLYSFEETQWTGASSEVIESNGSGLDGTVMGGATTATMNPATATNPGTCLYGDFDGVDDYIQIADAPTLDIANELTVAAWINMRSLPSELHTIVSKDWNYEVHINQNGQVNWWWNDSSGTTRSFTTGSAITLNQWHHVAITYQSGQQTIYVDGSPWATRSYTGLLRLNDLPLFIGTDYNFISRAFDGFIDEVFIASRAQSAAEVQALRNATHPCADAGAQFTINHDNFGIHCIPEAISVNVIDSNAGTPLINYNAQVELNTQTGNGSWILVSGSGGFSDAIADDGLATYNWPLGESQAQFALSYTQGTPFIDVDVVQMSDPGIRDTDAEGLLEFSANGFTVTATALSNPPPGIIMPFSATQTAAVPFDVHIAAYGQTPNDMACGVIESYTGNKNIQFWSTYQNPTTGTLNVTIDGAVIAANEGASAAQVVTFNNGQAQIVAKYKDVGSLQLALKDQTTINADLPAGIRGASAAFVSRPATLTLTDIRDASGATANPQAADATGPVFIAAGADFRATVTARDSDGDATPNFGREIIPETVRIETEVVAPTGGANPSVVAASGFGAFSGGVASGTDFRWNEVGIVQLRPGVGDSDYLGTGDVLGALSANVGRFVPDHFTSVLNTPMFATACGPGSFTYVGQTFNYAVAPTVAATARAVSGGITQNYTGPFFKMTTATLQNRNYNAITGNLDLSGLPADTVDPAVTESAPGVATLVFSGGDGLSFLRGAAAAPFDAEVMLSIDVIDSDSVADLSNPISFGALSGIVFNVDNEMRYGRVRFTNSVGSELVAMPVPLRAEYYASGGIGFVPNVVDGCTTGLSLSFNSFTENLAPGETCVLDSGSPGSSGLGCAVAAPSGQQFRQPPLAADFNLWLNPPGAGNTGSVLMEATVPSWLQFDWDGATPGNENPSGQATFGLFSGDNAQIYLRELY